MLGGAPGFVFALGYLFSPNAPLMYGTSSIPMGLNTALGMVALGTGLVAAAGPGAFPLSRLSGSSMRARLLRVFLPLVVTTVIGVAWLTLYVSRSAGASSIAITSAALATGAILLFSVVCERIERAEEAMAKAFDEMEDRVAECTRELIQSKALLERRNRELLQLAARPRAEPDDLAPSILLEDRG